VQLQKSMPFYMNQVEIKVLTEAFYYCASRTRQVLRRFPGLGHFEAKGIRDVRNHLLEHPEGDSSGVIENGVSCGDDCGPVLRGVRRSDKVDIFPDRGLYLNAEEFASNLHGKLDALLKARHRR
jgi:hypothetical protein